MCLARGWRGKERRWRRNRERKERWSKGKGGKSEGRRWKEGRKEGAMGNGEGGMERAQVSLGKNDGPKSNKERVAQCTPKERATQCIS